MRDIYAPLKSTKEENITPIINSWKAAKMKSHCVAHLIGKANLPEEIFFRAGKCFTSADIFKLFYHKKVDAQVVLADRLATAPRPDLKT